MQEFSADIYYTVGKVFGSLVRAYAAGNAEERITGAEISQDTLKIVQARCTQAGLSVSAALVAKLMSVMADAGTVPMTRQKFSAALDHINTTIIIEMGQSLFMYIDKDRAKLYNKPELFGTDVNARFPTVQFDIVEAGNCYAAGRGTAVVFHLMRIMEIGVQVFGTKLGVTLADEKNWQNILDEVNKAIKALPAKDPATVTMSQASANLYAVKLAWRNEVMHPKDTYTLEEADNLIRQVKIFMEQLATIV